MKREIIKTGDGSYTLWVPELNETYHSKHGAETESEHIFINSGLNEIGKKNLRILEFGFGTGLNVYLTYLHAGKLKSEVYYHTIEKYPVSPEEISLLNQDQFFTEEADFFKRIHSCPWSEAVHVKDNFTLFKEKSDFRTAKPAGLFDLVYFDAFSPDIQPDLWTFEIFRKVFELTSSGGILTTYSSKGQVRRNLLKAGFLVEKLPGPPGKREFLRARRAE